MPMNYGLRDGQRSMLSVTVREKLPRRAGGRESDSVNPSTHIVPRFHVLCGGRTVNFSTSTYLIFLHSVFVSRVNCRIWG